MIPSREEIMGMNRPEQHNDTTRYIITINKLNVDTRVTNEKHNEKSIKTKNTEGRVGVFIGHITYLLTG